MFSYITLFFCSLADYIAAANYRLDELMEQNQPLQQDNSSIKSHTSSNRLSTAQVSQFSLNHDQNPTAEVSLAQKAIPVDTSEVDALLEKFKSEVEVCHVPYYIVALYYTLVSIYV